jgi:chromate reductase, NAD(P)H dehydrogenase (quinone)
MAQTFRLLGIPGSLRRDSYNRATIRAAQGLVPDGTTLDIFDLTGIPLYSQDDEAKLPSRVVELKDRIRRADAIVFATPEYNYSVPGVLKNAIDWGSRPYGDNAWNGKPVAIMSASIGTLGAARAQYHLRQMFVFLNMHPLNQPEVMIANAQQRFDAQGNLTDETTREHIRNQLKILVDWAKRLQEPLHA